VGNRSKTINLRCSFCEKAQDEVAKLIAGPAVYICNECISLCNDVIADEVDAGHRIHNDLELAADRLQTLARHLSVLSKEIRKPGVEPQAVVLAWARDVAERTEVFMKALGTPETLPNRGAKDFS
jgi:hypothetical protein